MKRIAGVELEEKWRVAYALTKIKGIGWSLSKDLTGFLSIESSKRVKDLSPSEIAKLTAKIGDYPTEGELARNVKSSITRLSTIGSYRGARHTKGLPSRGQRTRSNARTKRGKRKTVGAFRKDALSKSQQGTKKEES